MAACQLFADIHRTVVPELLGAHQRLGALHRTADYISSHPGLRYGLGDEERRHHSIFYYFFSRAVWFPNELGHRILKLAIDLGLLPKDTPIVLTVDDTLCRRSGAHIWRGGMHHDALLSNYGRGKSLVKFFSFGHNWVIVCLCVRTPWNENRFMAVPIAFRMYRSKKQCPKAQL